MRYIFTAVAYSSFPTLTADAISNLCGSLQRRFCRIINAQDAGPVLMAQTKEQCTQLNTTVIYFTEKNKSILYKSFHKQKGGFISTIVLKCNMFTLLVARVSRMWRGHPSTGHPHALQIPTDTGTGIRGCRPPRRAFTLFTLIYSTPNCCRRVRGPDDSRTFGPIQ